MIEPVEFVTAKLLAIEERDLILVFHVLDVDAPLHRVRALDPRQRFAALDDARQDVERLHASGRDERPIGETECRKPAACRRRRQSDESRLGNEVAALSGIGIAVFLGGVRPAAADFIQRTSHAAQLCEPAIWRTSSTLE